ncbi:MAG: T9SS type A sorting domain-containing protein [Crocinitomicaceae bacterium]|nr:T9SS type A sorting domain-containing protein [Crocinitomicaceae bacterium]
MRSLLFLSAFIPFLSPAQCFNPGNGADGPFHATSDTLVVGGTYNYTSFEIDSGVTVGFTGTSPVYINCTGTMAINGVLTVSGGNGGDGVTFSSAGVGGIGVAGGANGGDGIFSASSGPLDGSVGNGAGAGLYGSGWSGGGGAGYAAIGGSSGGAGGAGGPSYGDANISGFEAGSGGGGGSGGFNCGSGGGGAGGGFMFINTNGLIISTTGVISSNGGDGGSDGSGSCGGGGGGSGGSLVIVSPTIMNDGLISAVGGIGGASTTSGSPYFGAGANGAEGRIKMSGSYSGSGTIDPAAGSTPTFVGPVTDSVTVNMCDGDSITVLSNVYYVAGVYNDTLSGGAMNGCDSVIVTTLTTEVLDATISVNGAIYSANQAGAAYQWINCGTNSAITGETNQMFTALSSGSYAVVVTLNNCSDTSACILFDNSGLTDDAFNNIVFYPNPTNNFLNIEIQNSQKVDKIVLTDIVGKVIYEITEVNEAMLEVDMTSFETGIYLVRIQIDGIDKTFKIMKN